MHILVPDNLTEADAARLTGFGQDIHLSRYGSGIEPPADADVLLARLMPPSALAELLRQVSRIGWVHTYSTGVDTLLLPELLRAQCLFTNSAGAIALPMAEWVLLAMTAAAKCLPEILQRRRSGVWNRMDLRMTELAGREVAILGLGSVGAHVARLSQAFGMRVTGITRDAQRARPHVDALFPTDRLSDAIAEADFIVVACALTAETHGVVDAAALSRAKPGAHLVNVARAPVVVEDALIASLRSGQLSSAWLDVFNDEPLPAGHPYWKLPNVVISPHVSSFSGQNPGRLFDLFLDNLHRYRQGQELRNVVDPARGY